MGWLKRCFWQCIMCFALLFQGPLSAYAAEILQVREADLLLIGDQNRNYSVRLACAEIKPGQAQNAIDFLRSQLPRRQRVNLMPIGSKDGLLLARVRPFGNKKDLTNLLIEKNLASLSPTCEPQKIS
jgi:hypothetical protein